MHVIGSGLKVSEMESLSWLRRVKIYWVPGSGPLTGGVDIISKEIREAKTFFRNNLKKGCYYTKKMSLGKLF